MLSVSDYDENKLLDKVLKGTDFTIANPCAALYSGARPRAPTIRP